jgi:hypothetical protein
MRQNFGRLQAKKQTRMAEQHKADDGHGVEQGSIS